MKKKKAFLLFGGLALMLAAYVAWCWHPLYVDPPLRYHGEVSAPHRELLEKWIPENAELYGWKPEGSWRVRGDSLLHPYEVSLTRLTVMAGGWPYYLRCENRGAVWYEELRIQGRSIIVQGAPPGEVAKLEKEFNGD